MMAPERLGGGAAAGAALIALGGCAAQTVEFHRLPPDTPAADNAADIAKTQRLAAAAARACEADEARAGRGREGAAAAEPPPPVTPAEAPPMKTYDPWGRINRFTYRFNARFDEAAVPAGGERLSPPAVADAHRACTTSSATSPRSTASSITRLQGRLGRMVRSVGRFVINSTIGIGGLFDPAAKFDLPKAPTGFGTTLAKWGMHPGPYLVIPFYGPSTLREGIGFAADYGTLYVIDPAWIYRGDQSWGLGVLNAVDQRANIDFRYYSSGSPFEYETIRFLYVRKLLIEDAGLHRQKPLPRTDPNVPAGE